MVRVYLNKQEFTRLGKDWASGKNDIMIPLGLGRRKQRHRLVSITPVQLDKIKRASGRRKGLKQKDGNYAFPDVYDQEQLDFENFNNFVFTTDKTITSAKKYLGWYSVISKKKTFNPKDLGKDAIKLIEKNAETASQVVADHFLNTYKGKLLAEVRKAQTLSDVKQIRKIVDEGLVDKGEDYVGEVEIALNEVESKIVAKQKREDSLKRRDREQDQQALERLARFETIDHNKVQEFHSVVSRLSKVRADEMAGRKAGQTWKVLRDLGLL